MTQELLRDDALPYREAIMRPGETLAWAFEWVNFLANRWFPGVPFATNAVIRPGVPTGFEYIASTGGLSGDGDDLRGEPIWPTAIGGTVQDGSVIWTAQAATNASLSGTISGSSWVADSGLSCSAATLTGTRTSALIAVAGGTADGDYFVRNLITLSTTEVKKGTLLIRVRAGAT